jgi:hypothetical protein
METNGAVGCIDWFVMKIAMDRSLEELLSPTVTAALSVGRMDGSNDGLVGPLADCVDAIIHDLSEALCTTCLITAADRHDRRGGSSLALGAGELW